MDLRAAERVGQTLRGPRTPVRSVQHNDGSLAARSDTILEGLRVVASNAARRRIQQVRITPRLSRRSITMSVSKFFRRFMVLAGLASCLALASCNTIEGAGEDVESAGEAVQDAADGD